MRRWIVLVFMLFGCSPIAPDPDASYRTTIEGVTKRITTTNAQVVTHLERTTSASPQEQVSVVLVALAERERIYAQLQQMDVPVDASQRHQQWLHSFEPCLDLHRQTLSQLKTGSGVNVGELVAKLQGCGSRSP